MWRPIGERYLKGKRIILHTDSARAYSLCMDDVVHTVVIHQRKKLTDTLWLEPSFVEKTILDLPGGGRFAVKSGTQTIDGWWTHLRRSLVNRGTDDDDRIMKLVRLAQWRKWEQGKDYVTALAHVISKDFNKRRAL